MTRETFKILDKLQEMNVSFCLQCQGENRYYNLMVKDKEGKEQYFNSSHFLVIEENLKAMWGHLLKPSMPTPKGFPAP